MARKLILMFKGLFCYEGSNIISQTKFMNTIGTLVVILMFSYLGVFKEIPEWLGWILVFMITPAKMLNKLIEFKWGISSKEEEDKEDKQ